MFIGMNVTLAFVIPAFNVDPYIGDALDSIEKQTCLPDEIIIIDDGSTDQTAAIIRSYLNRLPITFKTQENKGQGAARNLGARLACSDYIYFFDSDDIVSCNFVETIKIFLNGFRFPDLLMFSGRLIEGNSDSYLRGASFVSSSPASFVRTLKRHRSHISCSPCLYVVNRFMWNEKKLFFPCDYHEDEAILYPLIFSSALSCVVDTILFFRRIRPNSTMTMQVTHNHLRGAEAGIRSTWSLLDMNDNVSPSIRTLIEERFLFFVGKYLNHCLALNELPSLRALFGRSISFALGIKVFQLYAVAYLRLLVRLVRQSSPNKVFL